MNVKTSNSQNTSTEDQLLNLRPSIALEVEFSNEFERFQNLTLRPVLKFLHQTLISLFEDEIKTQNLQPNISTPIETREWLKIKFAKNNEFRNTITGMVLSLLTPRELQLFLQNKQEFKRRIFTMALERIASAINP
jgi:hypothetical protein